jgi:hypothetical protein
MKRVVSCFLTTICFAAASASPSVVNAQGGGVAVGFRNEMKTPVIVHGYTVINGMPKFGQAIPIPPGKTGVDIGVPNGPRLYRVHDGNNVRFVFIQNFPVQVQGRDIAFAIRGIAPKVTLEPLP